jgi:predicted RNA-binding Zn ribbon-like protein
MQKKPVNDVSRVITPSELPLILRLPLAGDRLCLDFVNTIDWRLRPELYCDTLRSYSELLAFALRLNILSVSGYSELRAMAELNPEAAESSFRGARAFRDALTAIIDDVAGTPTSPVLDTPRANALTILNFARQKAQATESIAWRDGRIDYSPDAKLEGFDSAWLPIVRDALELFSSEQASRVKVCAAEGCGWAFWDSSKNGKRRWCSMQLCGNREKARRFKLKDGN